MTFYVISAKDPRFAKCGHIGVFAMPSIFLRWTLVQSAENSERLAADSVVAQSKQTLSRGCQIKAFSVSMYSNIAEILELYKAWKKVWNLLM